MSTVGLSAAQLAIVWHMSMVVPRPEKETEVIYKVPYFWDRNERRCLALFLCCKQFQYLYGLDNSRLSGIRKIARSRLTHAYHIKIQGGKCKRQKTEVAENLCWFFWLNGDYQLPDRIYKGHLGRTSHCNLSLSNLYGRLYFPEIPYSWEDLEQKSRHLQVPIGPGEGAGFSWDWEEDRERSPWEIPIPPVEQEFIIATKLSYL